MVWRTLLLAVSLAQIPAGTPGSRPTDLDEFMRQVLARRDDNWKKLQQYVLDEHEAIDMRGPARTPIWGERRDYTWFIRDGFFVRSPLKVNGVTIGDADRRKYETDYLRRQQEREKRRARRQDTASSDAGAASTQSAGSPPAQPAGGTTADGPAVDLDGLLRQTREPQFISSAYFLRFRFEEGKYALVGRETMSIDGASPAEVLRIEYYPARLFRGTDRRRNDRGSTDDDKAYDAEFQRLMNKVSLVTLWIEPAAHQIVKYTFDNVALDFLPAQWLVHVDELRASMTMGQPFPEVWLPRALEFQAAMTLAVGQFDMRYALDYHDYRRADVATKITVPKSR